MADLRTTAEHKAQDASGLKAFNKFALGGMKDTVEELAGLIGRNPGAFATYTKHDISHIDAMLEMLDWLVPQNTQTAMTPTDWLLNVLSIYLHDLGLIVTSEEFNKRMSNNAFAAFLNSVNNDPALVDYLDRAKSIEPQNRELFFYQEYVRQNHAARISDWITGKTPYYYSDSLKPVVEAICEHCDRLPQRFREHLALVCESHHKDDLDDINRYPLYATYGSSSKETANVQYAAIILRTADLIHVTKDRTPSVM